MMARYIDAEKAADAISKYTANGFIFEAIDDVPTEDVAPVVRCRECKHYRNHPNGLCYLHTEPYTNQRGYKGEEVCVEPDDFCSFGERRSDE